MAVNHSNIFHKHNHREEIIDFLRKFGMIFERECDLSLIFSHTDFQTQHELFFINSQYTSEERLTEWAAIKCKSAPTLCQINNNL